MFEISIVDELNLREFTTLLPVKYPFIVTIPFGVDMSRLSLFFIKLAWSSSTSFIFICELTFSSLSITKLPSLNSYPLTSNLNSLSTLAFPSLTLITALS
ncbi:Uncharacterised protein [Campylobacter geochelonis]|uniref:Uncharacterized protein n=1 Tax=Campylobacter geochelonis TaxID=1780362 RepID=A0A128EMH1_9BACT|nr:Uncharacterised protein [Campylobacter geochelonis]